MKTKQKGFIVWILILIIILLSIATVYLFLNKNESNEDIYIEENTDKSISSDLKLFSNKEYGFSVKYNPSWEVSERKLGYGSFFSFAGTDKSRHSLQVLTDKQQLEGLLTPPGGIDPKTFSKTTLNIDKGGNSPVIKITYYNVGNSGEGSGYKTYYIVTRSCNIDMYYVIDESLFDNFLLLMNKSVCDF